MVITDEQLVELQAFCDERHMDCAVGVRYYLDGDQRVVIYPADAAPRMALPIGATFEEARRWLEERYGDLTGT